MAAQSVVNGYLVREKPLVICYGRGARKEEERQLDTHSRDDSH